jgi:peptidoglycan hydrolase-like protein with peptidoglycan-binding domain
MVEKLQNALTVAGFYKGEISGRYDDRVEEAVKAFQQSRSLQANGIAGQDTQRALGL